MVVKFNLAEDLRALAAIRDRVKNDLLILKNEV